MTTISETLFEELCDSLAIPWHRVAEAQNERRPDYEIELTDHRVVVEVKQFDPNPEESEAIRRLEKGGPVTRMGTRFGDRIRKAIQSAAPQLKALSKGECPTMLVVYNNVFGYPFHTDTYNVATAMQGLDVVPVLVPADPSIAPLFQDVRSGRDKKMTECHNTTISAIGVLVAAFDDRTHLCIYHNRHARHPIDPKWLQHSRVQHFRLDAGATSSLDCWERI